MSNRLMVFTDGGSRGNPGPAAAGVIIRDQEKILVRLNKYLGNTTNNVAEYSAVILAMDWLSKNSALIADKSGRIEFYADSTLVVNQLKGKYKIKSASLKLLIDQIKQFELSLKTEVIYNLIPREKNTEADIIVNQCLDEKNKSLLQ